MRENEKSGEKPASVGRDGKNTRFQETSNKDISPGGMLWCPSPGQIEESRLFHFMEHIRSRTNRRFESYHDLWQWSIEESALFWCELWDFCGIIGEKGSRTLINERNMMEAVFFPDAFVSYAENLLANKNKDKAAIIFRNEMGQERAISFKELEKDVARLASALIAAGVKEGDRVAGYLPNMPEAVIGALASNAVGAIWSSASPDFGVKGVVDRFGQIKPKIMLAADGYYYNGRHIDCLEKIKDIGPAIPSIEKVVIVPFLDHRPDTTGIDRSCIYADFVKGMSEKASYKRLPFNHPLFIMFSSGTTGKPKSIIHGQGGTLIQHLKEHQLHCNIHPGDSFFQYTTTGWMMWNWLVSALASGATLLLYDGSPFHSNPLSLWEYADKHKAALFGTGAKYIDALRNEKLSPGRKYPLKNLKTLTSTGSPLVHESFDYVYSHIKKNLHLASISGGTDIISCFVLGNPVSPVYRGEIQGAGLGMAVDVFDPEGHSLDHGEGAGELVCHRPFPSMPVGFWDDTDKHKYKESYFSTFENVWAHGDWVEKTPHGGYIIHGRSDATLNPGGVRIGTAEIYRQVEQIEAVKEAVAVGQNHQGDERILLFVVLNDGKELDAALTEEIKTKIRQGASPRHVPARIIKVKDIPRTKSGKIVELAVRDIIHGRPIRNKEALANADVLQDYAQYTMLE